MLLLVEATSGAAASTGARALDCFPSGLNHALRARSLAGKAEHGNVEKLCEKSCACYGSANRFVRMAKYAGRRDSAVRKDAGGACLVSWQLAQGNFRLRLQRRDALMGCAVQRERVQVIRCNCCRVREHHGGERIASHASRPQQKTQASSSIFTSHEHKHEHN